MHLFDYIVVGSGSAGAVVASRLSEDPSTRVLLIEAGGSKKPMNVKVPAAFPTQFKTDLDWEFYTEPEPHLGDRLIYHPRAKYLGGCSGMNAMIYIRGSRHDYDGWAKSDATGWSYDEVLPLFKRSENNSRGASEYHGDSGPLHIEDLRSPNPLTEALIAGMCSTGLPRNDDFNGADQVGAGYNQVTHKRGMRWTTADGYIRPAMKRPNFTVLTQAHVLRLRIVGGQVVGVEVERDGKQEFLAAHREVVLSAGAFNTPQLLMLSGIGPADHLAEHGIATIVDNPNVGAHLMDHPFYTANFETTAKRTLAEAQSPVQLVKYLAARRGMLTSNIGEAGPSSIPGRARTRRTCRCSARRRTSGTTASPSTTNRHSRSACRWSARRAVAGSGCGAPTRRRRSRPRSTTSPSAPTWTPWSPVSSGHVRSLPRLRCAGSPPRSSTRAPALAPASSSRPRSDETSSHTFHPSCTARIGTEFNGVVDPDLRVHGVVGLRVADASVFPTIPHGNTHAPTVLVGEKVADLIRAPRDERHSDPQLTPTRK